MVTVRAVVMSKVRPTVSPATVPGTVGLEFQLVAALQTLEALLVQLPLTAIAEGAAIPTAKVAIR